ncbi:MAG: alpha-amylase family glycosyl hydrolase, partial [Armatimonadota bacterium]
APDGGFGVLAVSNTRTGLVLAAWMDTRGEVNYTPSIHGNGSLITFAFANHRFYRMPPRSFDVQSVTVCLSKLLAGFSIESDVNQIHVVAGGLPAALRCYRQMVSETMPLDPSTPGWVKEAIILEVYPKYFKGGLKELTQKLPFYRKIGFNTIYLMPHWIGGYSPIDQFQVDPSLGTADDLREMVRTAHSLGMRVLFDMVIHGFNEKSPIVQQRPELFIRNEDGTIARHPAWKSMSTDWASSDYQQYMVDLVLHDLKEYDIDGYRVDAASYKGANWFPDIPYPAYRSGTAAPELMRRMISAMRRIKRDAVLLSEVFGPVFYTASNLVHDNQTEAPQQLLEMMDRGEANAATYKAHMANVFDMLPRGANRVFFARNHDTSWFYHFNGYTRRFLALDAIHALCAVPEVFAGDPDHGPNPDDDPAVYEYYRRLFALRAEYPEITRGELLLREVNSDNPWIFTAVRRHKAQALLIVVSLSDQAVSTEISFDGAVTPKRDLIQLRDPINEETVEAVSQKESGRLVLKLKPFQVLVGRIF